MKSQIAAGLVMMSCLSVGPALAQQGDTLVLPMEYMGISQPLYVIGLQQAQSIQGLVPATEMVQKHGPLITEIEAINTSALSSSAPSTTATQLVAAKPFSAVAGANFEGPGTGMPGFVLTGAPPDTTLAVGPSHVVAWVNSMYAVMDKAGNVLMLLNGNAPFAGTGSLCETTNRGDPILQYDRLADRWILSQFAFNVTGSTPSAPYLQCIAISQTNNPLGAFHRYAITFGSTAPNGFNDYGKLGIFPDAYYTAYNVFQGSPAGANSGAALCASDRAKMLVGDPTATTLCAPVAFYGGGAAFLPADLDGTTLPTTQLQGNIFMRQSTVPALRMLKLKPNFVAGTVTLNDGFGGAPGSFINLPLGPTPRACNGAGGACVRQPGTLTPLDTLGDRLMYRLAYRNRAGADNLVVTQSVDPDGAGPRGATLRWYEIRSPFAAVPTIFQNANYSPGSADRWMGSIATDKMGNMMIGYSVADVATNLKPSVRVAGRLRSDLRNQLQSEHTLITGTGSQTGTLTRWGDYTTMQVDPVDDCTFWYIGQYLSANGIFNWRTRIGSYKFNGCN